MAWASSIFQLVYGSAETVAFSSEQLIELLKKSRTNNEKISVTGMLLYKAGNFLQVLEGEERAVRNLKDRIAVDPRHKSIITVYTATSEKRDFPDWSMGFHDLSAAGKGKIEAEGYSRLLDSDISAAHLANDPPQAKKLLLAFKIDGEIGSLRNSAAAAK